MPRFFIAPTEQTNVEIFGEDAKHIVRSLRLRTGDKLTLSDEAHYDYQGEITAVSPEGVQVTILEKYPNTTEPRVQITLYQALPKGDKLSFVVEKAVELGAVRIVPVLTSRCISRPTQDSMHRKIEKLSRTAAEAAKQAGRGMIPTVGDLLTYAEALAEMAQADIALLCYEQAKTPLKLVLSATAVAQVECVSILVGCEGGLSEQEVAEAVAAGVLVVSLGARILRTETAPVAALAALFYALE